MSVLILSTLYLMQIFQEILHYTVQEHDYKVAHTLIRARYTHTYTYMHTHAMKEMFARRICT